MNKQFTGLPWGQGWRCEWNDVDGGREEGRRKAMWLDECLRIARMSERSKRENERRDGRRKTCRGRDVCISEDGESGGGVANGLVCCNG